MSEAFDTAWDLLKMPIVPNSLVQDKNDKSMYSASFRDPKTNEIIPMEIGMGTGTSYAQIKHPDEQWPRSETSMKNWGYDGYNNRYEARGTNTGLKYERRGYATALYNILAHLLKDKKYNGVINASDELYDDGQSFWENAIATGKTSKDGSWRGDLYERL